MGSLLEFLPSNPNLLGLNVNKGMVIKIRLRPAHGGDQDFLDFNDLLGTMLHELVHISRSPHDAVFYKLLDELWDEYESEIDSRIPDGSVVGGRQMSDLEAKRIQIMSAEKRAALAKVMIPAGGRRLGGHGGSHRPKDLRQAILDAAERRARDSKWCGEDHGNDDDGKLDDSYDEIVAVVGAGPSNPSLGKRSSMPSKSNGKSNSASKPLPPQPKKRVLKESGRNKEKSDTPEVIILDSSDDEQGGPTSSTMLGKKKPRTENTQQQHLEWTCRVCTLINKPVFLACDACANPRF